MTVTVLLFASYAESLGKGSLLVDIGPATTAGDVLRHVQGLAGGHRLPRQPLLAVNQRYAKAMTPLADGDELAIIPPVAGG